MNGDSFNEREWQSVLIANEDKYAARQRETMNYYYLLFVSSTSFFFHSLFSSRRHSVVKEGGTIYRFVFNGLSRRSGHRLAARFGRPRTAEHANPAAGPDRPKNTIARCLNASNDNTAFIEETRALPVAANAAPFEYQIKRGKYAAWNSHRPIQRVFPSVAVKMGRQRLCNAPSGPELLCFTWLFR